MKVKPNKKLRDEMFKRVFIALVLLCIAVYILTSIDGDCFSILFRELCNSNDKSVILNWLLVFDSLLVLYVMAPFVYFGAVKFLIKSKNKG